MYLARINKRLLCFNYHLSCRHINDNAGDIKLCVLLISQNTLLRVLGYKFHRKDGNRLDLKCICLQSIKSLMLLLLTKLLAY